jgi:hypothetical protein
MSLVDPSYYGITKGLKIQNSKFTWNLWTSKDANGHILSSLDPFNANKFNFYCKKSLPKLIKLGCAICIDKWWYQSIRD